MFDVILRWLLQVPADKCRLVHRLALFPNSLSFRPFLLPRLYLVRVVFHVHIISLIFSKTIFLLDDVYSCLLHFLSV
jgi:hypothetical protein